jgi:hypothetical protein
MTGSVRADQARRVASMAPAMETNMPICLKCKTIDNKTTIQAIKGSLFCEDHQDSNSKKATPLAKQTAYQEKLVEKEMKKKGEEFKNKEPSLIKKQKKGQEDAQNQATKNQNCARDARSQASGIASEVRALRVKHPTISINAGVNGSPVNVTTMGGTNNPLKINLPSDVYAADVSALLGTEGSDSGTVKLRYSDPERPTEDIFVHLSFSH